MRNNPTGFLSIIIPLVVVLFIITLLNVSQPDHGGIISTLKPIQTLESQAVYPAPGLLSIDQLPQNPAAYPPPGLPKEMPTNPDPGFGKNTQPTTILQNLTIDMILRTSMEDAKKAFDKKQAIFLDVRSLESYKRNHIQGAVSMPEAQVYERFMGLDPNQWIITYCS